MHEDERVQYILDELASGKTREDIANAEGKQWKSIDMYMRRQGFKWSQDLQTYMIKPDNETEKIVNTVQINTKAAQVIRMLDVKHPNIRQVANKQGFESVEALGTYMKGQGYSWNDELQNYQKDVCETIETVARMQLVPTSAGGLDEQSILQLLVQNQERLLTLLNLQSTSTIQTYRFTGTKQNKTLTLASSVIVLLEDYQKEFNLTQRTIVETALAEFFERNGYAEQVRIATNS